MMNTPMDENLIIKSYWKICGLNEDEINSRYPENLIQSFNEKHLTKETLENNSDKESTFVQSIDNQRNVHETITVDQNTENQDDDENGKSITNFCDDVTHLTRTDKTLEKSTLLPSSIFNLDKLLISEKEQLDHMFIQYLEAGIEKGRQNGGGVVKDHLDFRNLNCQENHQELFQSWCSAGYKTGIVFGLLRANVAATNNGN